MILTYLYRNPSRSRTNLQRVKPKRIRCRLSPPSCTFYTTQTNHIQHRPASSAVATDLLISYNLQHRLSSNIERWANPPVFFDSLIRQISSTAFRKQVYKDDQEFLQAKVTNRLLGAEIGSLNQSSLLELKTAISSWCSLASSNSHKKVHDFHQAKLLFDRLIQEYIHYKDNERVDIEKLGVVQIDLDTINSVLDCWRLFSNAKMSTVKSYSKRQDVQGVVKSEIESFGNIGGQILKQCCELAQKYGHIASASPITSYIGAISHPDAKSFNIVIDGIAKLGNAQEASQLFNDMNYLAKEKKLPQCRPDRISYNTLLYAYANSKSDQLEYAQKAHQMLDEMIELYSQTGNPDMKPDVIAFSSVIGAYANAAPFSPQAPYQAEELLQTMNHMYTSSLIANGGDGEWVELKPNSYCYTMLITAWTNSGEKDASDRAAEIVSQMEAAGNDETTMENLTALMSTYANGIGDDNLDQAEHLLDSMVSMAESSGDNSLMPSPITFVALLDCFAQSAERKVGGDGGNAALRGERVVKKMEDLYESGNGKLEPVASVYNALINIWGKSKRPDAGEKAEAILNKMNYMNDKGFNDVKPNAITFTSVIKAYANNSNGKEAEKILMQMYERYKNGDTDCQPNVISFATAIDAYANQGMPSEAEKLFSQMTLPGLEEIEPNATCFNSVLKSYLNSNQHDHALRFLDKLDKMGISDSVSYSLVIEKLSKLGNKWAVEKGEELLSRMWYLYNEGNTNVKPHANIYNSVINLMAKSIHLPTRAKSLDLLYELRRNYNETNDEDLMPNTVSYNAAMSAFTKNTRQEDVEKAEELLKEMEELYHQGFGNVKPDMFTLTNLIACYANSNIDGSAERAEDILNHMQGLYEEGDLSMRPTKVAFGAVLNAWARVGNAQRATAILDHMESLHDGNEEMIANNVIFNTLINSWAKTKVNREESGLKAEKILRKMQKLYGEGRHDVKPCRITYNSVLSAYNNSNNAEAFANAKDILEEMESSIDSSLHPDIITYTTLINIVAKWNNKNGKIAVTEQILERIKSKQFSMNNFTYDAVLRACIHSNTRDPKSRRKALVLAVKTFSAMESPTSYSYSLFFNAVSKLSSGDEQTKLLSHSLHNCCKAGLLTELTFNQLKDRISSSAIKSILAPSSTVDEIQFRHIPPEWSCNAKKSNDAFSRSRTTTRKNNRTAHNTGRQRNRG